MKEVDRESEVIQRARKLRESHDEDELRDRIAKLESEIESYQTEYGHESPEEADQFGDIDEEEVEQWAQLRADKAVAMLALRLSEAVRDLDVDQLIQYEWNL